MNQPSPGPQNGANTPGTAPEAHTGKTPGASLNSTTSKAVLGPFTIRDLTVFASTLLLFVGSLIPMFGGRYNLWNLGNLFFLALGIVLPVIVTALFVARRLQPGNVIRIGSLSIDQFASVVASFALTLFFLTTAGAFTPFVLLGLIGAVGLFAATVLAPHLPYLSADFKGRAEIPAHAVARESAVPERAPRPPKPASAQPRPTPANVEQANREPANHTPRYGQMAPRPGAVSQPPAAPAAPATQASAVVPPAAPAKEEASAVVPPAAPAKEEASAIGAQDSSDGPAEAAAAATSAASHAPATQAAPSAANAKSSADYDATPPTMAAPTVSRGHEPVRHSPIGATVDPASRPEESEEAHAYEAFWFAVPQPRTAVDVNTGAPAFTVEPGGWVLALEDRGDEFLVQNTDGRVGLLRDVSHIERG